MLLIYQESDMRAFTGARAAHFRFHAGILLSERLLPVLTVR